MHRLSLTAKRIDRWSLSLARSKRFRLFVMLFLACVVATVSFGPIKAPLAGIVHDAERTVLPHQLTRLGNDLVNFSVSSVGDYGWSNVMQHLWWRLFLTLIVAGILLHAILVYFEIKERLQQQIRWRRPILWKALAIMGALLIAIPALNEFGGVLS